MNSEPIYIQIRKPQWNIIFFDDFWKKETLVFLTFNDNLLALNQLLTFVSSLFIFKQDVNVTLSKPDIGKKSMNLSCLLLWVVSDMGDLVISGISSVP